MARTVRLATNASIMAFLLLRREQATDFAKLLGRGSFGCQRLHNELRGRSAERALEQLADKPSLHLVLGVPRPVKMLRPLLLPAREPLLSHDLQQLQRGGIGKLPPSAEDLVNLTDSRGSLHPEDPQDGELRVGGLRYRPLRHGDSLSTKCFVCQRRTS